MPTVVMILILAVGNLMAVAFEKVFLLQNPLNLATSEVIATYVYKTGLLNADFCLATAVGLFNSGINLVLLLLVNTFAKRITGADCGSGVKERSTERCESSDDAGGADAAIRGFARATACLCSCVYLPRAVFC